MFQGLKMQDEAQMLIKGALKEINTVDEDESSKFVKIFISYCY